MKRLFLMLLVTCSFCLYAQTPGNALNFDGSNDMVVANATPAAFANLSANDFTFEAWVNPASAVFSRIIFVQANTANFATMSTGATANIYFYVVAGSTTYSVATTNNLPLGQWTHVACVWTAATQTVQVYFNGVLQAGSAGGTSSTGTSGLTVLGSRPGGAQYFPGSMDEVRIWSEARTQCEIQANMNSEFNTLVTNLDVYYKFNEGVAAGNNTLVTTLPTANTTFNGTLTNFTLTGATSNWIASAASINNVGPNIGVVGNTFTTSICANDTFIFGGIPRTVTGIYTDTLTAINGCDSLATLDLTVLLPITSSVNEVACDQFNFNNLILTASGIYSDTLTSYTGCDSVITLDLTINSADVTVNQNGIVLSSPATNATFQWLDCTSNFTPLAGETSSSYTPNVNGSYAVEVTQDGCTDTSACLNVVTFGWDDETGLTFTMYPNPTDGKVLVELFTDVDNNLVTIMNVNGEVLQTKTILKGQINELDLTDYSSGVYFIQAFVNGTPVNYKVIRK